MKMSGGVDFKARMVIKLEENALGYLVKKWNDLEVAVEGETVVKAELAGATPAKVGQGRNRIMHSCHIAPFLKGMPLIKGFLTDCPFFPLVLPLI